MSMGLGYASARNDVRPATSRLLNRNLLDYKLPTAMDTPSSTPSSWRPTTPPVPSATRLWASRRHPRGPAVRNAMLHATGVAVATLPLTPQKLVEAFQSAGLIGR